MGSVSGRYSGECSRIRWMCLGIFQWGAHAWGKVEEPSRLLVAAGAAGLGTEEAMWSAGTSTGPQHAIGHLHMESKIRDGSSTFPAAGVGGWVDAMGSLGSAGGSPAARAARPKLKFRRMHTPSLRCRVPGGSLTTSSTAPANPPCPGATRCSPGHRASMRLAGFLSNRSHSLARADPRRRGGGG